MKSIYLILFFAFVCFSSQSAVGGYQKLDPERVYKDAAAKEALNFGAKALIVKAIYTNKIPNDGKYDVRKVISAAKQIVAGTNYKFEVKIENAKRTAEIYAKYIVFQNIEGEYSLISSFFQVKKRETVIVR